MKVNHEEMMKELQAIMASGWDVHIECKGKGRTFDMTYEANAKKVIEDVVTASIFEKMLSLCPINVVGDTMHECITQLQQKITQVEGSLL